MADIIQDDIDKKITIIKQKKQKILEIRSGKRYQRLATKNRGAMEQMQFSKMNNEIDKLKMDVNELQTQVGHQRVRLTDKMIFDNRPDGNNIANPHVIKSKKESNKKDHIKEKNPAVLTKLEPRDDIVNTHNVYPLHDISFINNAYDQPDSDSLEDFFS